jgi:hypothetical protein
MHVCQRARFPVLFEFSGIYIRNRSNARDLIGSQTYAKRLHGGVCDDSIGKVATVAHYRIL